MAAQRIRNTTPTAQPTQQEPVGEVMLERMGIDDAQVVRFQMYKEIPPVGTKLYTSPQPAQRKLPPEWYAQWIRNNYQDHPNIATLCEEMTKAAHSIKENP